MNLIEKFPRIRIIIWFLGLPTSAPIRLSGIIYIIGLALWGIFVYVKEVYLQITLVIFTGIISFLFLTFVITLMFPPAKRIKNILDAYGDDPKIILFTAKEVKKWLEKVINYMEKQPNLEKIREAIALSDSDRLEKLQKRFRRKSSTKRLKGRIKKEGKYLNGLIEGVSESLQIPRESIEELIDSKIDVNQKIGEEVTISYEQIEASIKGLAANGGLPSIIVDYHKRRIKERTDYLESNKDRLNTQIKWLKELDKRKEDISALLKIIKEPSTGKAVSNLARLLSEKAKTVGDLKWLIQFANSRKGAKISELVGLEIKEGIQQPKIERENRALNPKRSKNFSAKSDCGAASEVVEMELCWYGTSISQENLPTVKGFLGSFVRLRSDALEELWQKFREWNRETNKLDLTQPIATGLTFGYSAALRKILQGLCKENKQFRTILISSEEPGAEEILKAELIADCPGLKCDIMPFEVIKKREIQRQIGVIFVGMEKINKHGDVVHPRGGSAIDIKEYRKKIKECGKYLKVYAVGESYKVQDFTEDDLDYTKLSLIGRENIDYVVTDHGVHEKEGDNWRIESKLKNNLDCCAKYWEGKLKEFFDSLK